MCCLKLKYLFSKFILFLAKSITYDHSTNPGSMIGLDHIIIIDILIFEHQVNETFVANVQYHQ